MVSASIAINRLVARGKLVSMLVTVVVAGVGHRSMATTIASDSASNNPPYSGSSFVGLDGGTGFQAWTASTSGGGGSYLGSTGLSGTSFGIYAGGGAGNSSTVNRPFDIPLALGDTFSVQFQPTSISSGGSVGVLFFSNNIERGVFYFSGGSSNWGWNDGAGGSNTNLGFSGMVQLSLTRTGTNTYSLDLTQGATTQTIAGTFTGNSSPVSSSIDMVGFYSSAQGGGENFGFNNLQVVPEPSGLAIAAGSMVALLAGLKFGRRRRVAGAR